MLYDRNCEDDKEIMLEDLNCFPLRKEEYMSEMGLAVLFDRIFLSDIGAFDVKLSVTSIATHPQTPLISITHPTPLTNCIIRFC